MTKKARNLYGKLALFTVLVTFVLGSVFGSSGGPIIENALIELISNNPEGEITIIVSLDTNNEGMLDDIKEATNDIDMEIEAISQDFKRKYKAMNMELGYYQNEQAVLESFKKGEQNFLKQIESLQAKYGLDFSTKEEVSAHVDYLKSIKTAIIANMLYDRYATSQQNFIDSLKNIPTAQVVNQDFLTNTVAIKIKAADVGEVARISGINEIIYGEWPDKQELQNSVPTIGATTWHSNGYTGGSSSVPLFLSLEGLNKFHPDIDHINFVSNCFFVGCNPINLTSGHDTAVAGVIGSNNVPNKGVSPTITQITNAQTNNFLSAQLAINWSIVNVVNPQLRADHITMSKEWGDGNPNPEYCGDMVQEEYVDEIVDLFDIDWAKSAGNNGGQSYDGMTLPAGAYNIIAVGASNDGNTVNRTTDTIWSGSSIGPVGVCNSGETRIKPDIVAPGVGIQAPSGSSGMGLWTGTSFASPHVTGSIVLIDQLTSETISPEETRALLFNSAEDRLESTGAPGNDGPDNTWGYGYLDMNKAFFEVADVDKGNIAGEGNSKFYRFESAATNDKATIVWNRHIVNNEGVTNNLDLFFYDEANGNLIDSSEFIGRNIEQVQSNADYNSTIVKVDLKSLETGLSEDFGIAVNGQLSAVNGPQYAASLNVPSLAACGASITIDLNVTNNGIIAVHNVVAQLNLPSEYTLINGTNPQSLGSIYSGELKTAQWKVLVSGAGNKNINTTLTSSTYGKQIVQNVNSAVTVGKPEICGNIKDDDCDGKVDEGCATIGFPPGGPAGNPRSKACQVNQFGVMVCI